LYSIKKILGDPTPFLNRLLSSIAMDGIDLSGFVMDHICYRVESIERYEVIKKDMEEAGVLLSESDVDGRPIASYKLHKPIVHKKWKIDVIEIPSPKEGKFYPEGYEHAEFVIDMHLAEFMAAYLDLVFDKKNLLREINPELTMHYDDYSVKFHRSSLEDVIKAEQMDLK